MIPHARGRVEKKLQFGFVKFGGGHTSGGTRWRLRTVRPPF